jgi:hypothetical protein
MSNNGPVISRSGNLEVFGRETDTAIVGKRFDGQTWSPSPLGWENLGGEFTATPAVVAWDTGTSHLDIFAPGLNQGMFHKARDNFTWLPSPLGWEDLGGGFRPVAPAVASWGANRLDIFSVGLPPSGVQHKWWDGQMWQPSQFGWEDLGGLGLGPTATPAATPAATTWGANRLDIFGISSDKSIAHKWWDGQMWQPSQSGWEVLGGPFSSPPAAATWGANRLDVFGVGANSGMWHKWWDGQTWSPSQLEWDWEPLGGSFTSRPPAVVASTANRLDIFARGFTGAISHKWWDGQTWQPSQLGWELLGGGFLGPPWWFTGPLAAVGFPSGRVDVLCRAFDGAMYHKGWYRSIGSAQQDWHPSGLDWEPLGGQFLL